MAMPMKMSLFLQLLGVFCLLTYVSATIIDPPQNDAVEFGYEYTLNCQASGTAPRVTWQEYATNPLGAQISINEQVLAGHPNAARYVIVNDTATSTYNLRITETVLNDGGLYRCQDISDSSPPAFAQLSVLDGHANCTTNIPPNGFVTEGVYYTIECIIFFRGIGPNFTWTGPPADTGVSWGQATAYSDTAVWSGVNMNMSRYFGDYGFQAHVNFSGQGFTGIPNQANNIPVYSYDVTWPDFYVRWRPGNMYLSPDGPYEIGTVIYCWADAFPQATYFWQNMETNQVTYTQTLTTTAAMAGTTLYRCNANNGIGTDDLFVNITVNPVTETTTPTTTQTTTTPPPEGPCNDLTGRWRATSPSVVDLCIEVNSANGQVIGLFRNATDPYFIEVRGSVQPGKYDEIGFVGVWPVNIGTQGFTGVCSNCFGTEHLQINAAGRKITDFANCVNFGQIYYSSFYEFTRVGPPCRGLFAEYGIKI